MVLLDIDWPPLRTDHDGERALDAADRRPPQPRFHLRLAEQRVQRHRVARPQRCRQGLDGLQSTLGA